jgi:hypothetical protein
MYTKLVYMIILFALVGLLPIANAQQKSVTLYCRDAIELGFAASMMMNDVYPNIIVNSPDMPSDILEMIKSTNATVNRANIEIQLACNVP